MATKRQKQAAHISGVVTIIKSAAVSAYHRRKLAAAKKLARFSRVLELGGTVKQASKLSGLTEKQGKVVVAHFIRKYHRKQAAVKKANPMAGQQGGGPSPQLLAILAALAGGGGAVAGASEQPGSPIRGAVEGAGGGLGMLGGAGLGGVLGSMGGQAMGNMMQPGQMLFGQQMPSGLGQAGGLAGLGIGALAGGYAGNNVGRMAGRGLNQMTGGGQPNPQGDPSEQGDLSPQAMI